MRIAASLGGLWEAEASAETAEKTPHEIVEFFDKDHETIFTVFWVRPPRYLRCARLTHTQERWNKAETQDKIKKKEKDCTCPYPLRALCAFLSSAHSPKHVDQHLADGEALHGLLAQADRQQVEVCRVWYDPALLGRSLFRTVCYGP